MSDKNESSSQGLSNVVESDAGIPAPAASRASDAPEVDWARNAPEITPHEAPQPVYGESQPIPVDQDRHEKLPVEGDRRLETEALSASICGISRRSFCLVLAAAILSILGLGLGLGLGLRGKSAAHSSEVTNSTTSTFAHGVLEDSSFAAVVTPDGVRHLFFQDLNGTLRQGLLSTTSQTWASSLSSMIPDTTDAKQRSPMSAIVLDETDLGGNLVSTAALYNYRSSDSWENATAFLNVSEFLTAPKSRSVAATQIPANNNGSSELMLWFEGADGQTSGLKATHAKVFAGFSPSTSTAFWTWTDTITALKAASFNHSLSLGAPFTMANGAYWPDYPTSNQAMMDVWGLFFVENTSPEHSVVYSVYLNSTWSSKEGGFSLPSSGLAWNTSEPSNVAGTPFVDSTAVAASDWASTLAGNLADPNNIDYVSLWINGSTLSSLGAEGEVPKYVANPPETPFPYTRLAVTSPKNTTAFYLYHQINQSAVAEDIWDGSVEAWTSSTITIQTN